jgi:hypothetical protein
MGHAPVLVLQIGAVDDRDKACQAESGVIPPTSDALRRDETKPYFLWWTDCTAAELRRHLADPDPATRGYWLGAMLREANSRDVWLFTSPAEVRASWPHLVRHLGKSRAMWAWLLEVQNPGWPPTDARHA